MFKDFIRLHMTHMWIVHGAQRTRMLFYVIFSYFFLSSRGRCRSTRGTWPGPTLSEDLAIQKPRLVCQMANQGKSCEAALWYLLRTTRNKRHATLCIRIRTMCFCILDVLLTLLMRPFDHACRQPELQTASPSETPDTVKTLGKSWEVLRITL